jgi:hypothetical protein
MTYFGCVNKFAQHVYFLANLKYAGKLPKHVPWLYWCSAMIIIWPDYSFWLVTSAGRGSQFCCIMCLQHIIHTGRQMETKETLRRLMQHIQTVSKSYFYNKILTSKNFSKPLGTPLPCVQYIDPKVPLQRGELKAKN